MTPEEEFQKYALLIENYKMQLESLENQFSLLQAAILDYSKAKLTLETLKKTKQGTELLIPLGGGTFTYAKAAHTSKILTEVGGGIILEKTPAEAIKTINKRIENLQQTQETISKMSQKIQKELIETSNKAQKLLSQQK